MARLGRMVAWPPLSAAALALVGLAMPGASAATNQLANPGFETGNLSGWTCDGADSAVTGHAHSGTFALAGAADNASTAQCSQTVSLAANTAYQLTAFVNGGGATPPALASGAGCERRPPPTGAGRDGAAGT